METINQQINKANATKKKSKIYADKRRGAKQPKLKVGDQVLVRQRKWNKLTSKFKHKPYKITTIKGKVITACQKGHQITRNCSFFKTFLIHGHDDSSENDEDSGVSGGENVAHEDASAAPDRPEAGPVEDQNDPAAEVNEPVEDHLQREHRYPKKPKAKKPPPILSG